MSDEQMSDERMSNEGMSDEQMSDERIPSPGCEQKAELKDLERLRD